MLLSDYCRGLVSDDASSQAATNDAFDVLYDITANRLVRFNDATRETNRTRRTRLNVVHLPSIAAVWLGVAG